MTWDVLLVGAHAGKTMPAAFFDDPEYVLGGAERRVFVGPLLAQAQEVSRRAQRIRVPRDRGQAQVAVLYRLLPDGSFGGCGLHALSDPRFSEYERFSAARSDLLDMTVPRRIAPMDRCATKLIRDFVLWLYTGDPHATLSPNECVAFFEDPRVISL